MVMELGGNRLTQVHLEKWPLKWSVCVITELAVYLVLLVVVVAVLRTKYRWIRWWNQLQQPRTTHRHRQDLMHILLSKYNHSLTSLYRCNPSSLVCSLVVSDCFRATAYHRSGLFLFWLWFLAFVHVFLCEFLWNRNELIKFQQWFALRSQHCCIWTVSPMAGWWKAF